ncbi:probable LRR receptor-like serine/threonine-protein kinase At3g47570 [Punica granatum]|uniref:non-specific serine/threonine protein kinase n=2 Tax=Punica granatum TaxID=22663 RepID=A0A6P8DMJ7_PUNGR|nr:probable LRR receptor-like serine/threonine-protein kinase At3g47570 [Punica granatum]
MLPKTPNCSLKILALMFILYRVAASRPTNETDYQALLAFKSQIASDPYDALNTWNDSIHFCAWTGVICGKKHQRVTALRLPSFRLVGPVSPHIWNLTFLKVLNLNDNHLKGILPQEIGQLSRLQELRLSNNSFEGELPRNLTYCADLRILRLNGNNLRGELPDQFFSLMKLTRIELSSNHFTGEIPSVLGNLTALTQISLGDNHIQGSILPQLGRLPNLKYLVVEVNSLSGHIPTSLYNISSILIFSVAVNNLSGSLPSDLFLAFPKLEDLLVSVNEFSGLVPSSIANASRARMIDASRNALVGPVPINLGGLKNLQVLNFEVNHLGTEEGDDLSFFTSLINCTKLQVLSFTQNRLKGVLPNSIANFSSSLTQLWVSLNFISGTIPSGISNLVNLQLLALSINMLTGRIPSSIVKLSQLQGLYLRENNLSGVIPASTGNMTSLFSLYLGYNRLDGTIPASLGNCMHLNRLRLDENRVVGPVPQEVFGLSSLSILNLSGNSLTGPIPSQVGKLMNLQALDLSENNMSGVIPPTLGDCQVLEYLYLGANQFNGTIPTSTSKLRGVKFLILSRNKFSGQIPGFLADLPAIESLDLSFNKFQGKVPNRGIFRNHSAVHVVGNNDLCGGPSTLQLPKCKGGAAEKHRKRTSSKRTVLVITVTISIFSLLAAIATIILYCLKRSKRGNAFTFSTEGRHPKLSYGELSQATNGFSSTNMIGEGSFGAVYKGVLPSNGQNVAVKVLKLEEQGAGRSFMAECEALRNIRHRNLVKIITSCSGINFRGEDFKALVYEFMPSGSLDKWLHPVPNEIGRAEDNTRLSVTQRLNVAIDVATAVDYLHHQCQTPIVHSDLKPSNILLDSDFSAHASDFGLSKFLKVKASGTQSGSIGIRGTIGYVAPEYGVGGEVSTRADIYSFGILLLELFTGKRPTDPMFGGEFDLRGFVERSIPDGLNQVLDPLLCLGRVQGNLRQCLLKVLRVGLMCSAAQPNERMNTGGAAAELQKAQDVLQGRRRRNRV